MDDQGTFDFSEEPEEVRFDGSTYDANLDRDRLRAQLNRVRALMQDSEWRTLFEISDATGDPSQSISARLRDLRKERFGSHTVNRRRRSDGTRGLFEYQLILNGCGVADGATVAEESR